MKNNYKTYFLRFATEQEAIAKLTEVNYYRTIEVTYPKKEVGEIDPETGEPLEETDSDSETEKVIIKSYYTVGDIPGGIDIVGEIWNDDGVYETDEETGEISVISEATKKDGWHVNVILASDLPEELQEFVVEPVTPSRRFAGF